MLWQQRMVRLNVVAATDGEANHNKGRKPLKKEQGFRKVRD